jgi:hypothetical protein
LTLEPHVREFLCTFPLCRTNYRRIIPSRVPREPSSRVWQRCRIYVILSNCSGCKFIIWRYYIVTPYKEQVAARYQPTALAVASIKYSSIRCRQRCYRPYRRLKSICYCCLAQIPSGGPKKNENLSRRRTQSGRLYSRKQKRTIRCPLIAVSFPVRYGFCLWRRMIYRQE